MMPDHREVLTLNVGCSQWSSRKGTVLFGMFHKEELVLMDDIHRKISTPRKKAVWVDKLASYRKYFVVRRRSTSCKR